MTRHAISLVLVALGLVVAVRLTLDQTGVVPSAWEPFFGQGTEHVLHSSIARALPVPDALLGAIAYSLELLALLVVTADRHATWPELAYGAIAAAMALGSIVLVLLQAFVIHAWCTLCLVSAFVSFVVLALAVPDVVRAAHRVRTRPSWT